MEFEKMTKTLEEIQQLLILLSKMISAFLLSRIE